VSQQSRPPARSSGRARRVVKPAFARWKSATPEREEGCGGNTALQSTTSLRRESTAKVIQNGFRGPRESVLSRRRTKVKRHYHAEGTVNRCHGSGRQGPRTVERHEMFVTFSGGWPLCLRPIKLMDKNMSSMTKRTLQYSFRRILTPEIENATASRGEEGLKLISTFPPTSPHPSPLQ